MDYIDTDDQLNALGEWSNTPDATLRQYGSGTLFLLQERNGRVDVCVLRGNLASDQNWKFMRLSDCRFKVAHKLRKGARVLVLREGLPVATTA